jgi:CheY-like chemotaxis protein
MRHDNPEILTLFTSAIDAWSCDITTAPSGELAIEALSKNVFDLVITDP